MDIPVAQQKRRVRLDGDACVIDDAHFFVRGCLEIPVRGSRTPFVWGVWVRVSQTSFRRFKRLSGIARRAHHRPFAGRLSSPPLPYPDSLNLKARVQLRDGGQRALIELEECGHPLALEQRCGITRRRVAEICGVMIHHSSGLVHPDIGRGGRVPRTSSVRPEAPAHAGRAGGE
jgi:hypothetical protein